jgi:hypothetical protein
MYKDLDPIFNSTANMIKNEQNEQIYMFMQIMYRNHLYDKNYEALKDDIDGKQISDNALRKILKKYCNFYLIIIYYQLINRNPNNKSKNKSNNSKYIHDDNIS